MSFAWLLLLAAALICRPAGAVAQDVVLQGPRIGAIRVGLAGCYLLGHWTPVWVEADGVAALKDPRAKVTVVDSDGVATTAAAPLQPSNGNGAKWTAVVYTKIGRRGAEIQIALVDGDEPIAEKSLRANGESITDSALVELPAAAELVVAVGNADTALRQAFADRDAAGGEPARRLLELNHISDLPTAWFGYEAVDVLLLDANDAVLGQRLAADAQRFAALVEWVELGGRLVLLCGGDNAAELLADGQPLSLLAPGQLADVFPLTETGPLEQFAEPAGAIPHRGAGAAMLVPRLLNVVGRIEVYAGWRQSDPPLVVRFARGLGEVTFAGVDLSRPPLSQWPDRHRFLQALHRPYVSDSQPQDESQTLVARGYDDLSGALRQRLGRTFSSLTPIGFSLVAVLAIAYVLVLGPIDYVVVQRWLRRPLMAWITFPAIVLLFGIGAVSVANWRVGSTLTRLNRLELVDVDLATRIARGTLWATLYSPRAKQFDLTLQVDPFISSAASEVDALLSSWGLTGAGIGGMEARVANVELAPFGYRYSPDLASLHDLPVGTSSTKSLTARWVARPSLPLEANLTERDGLPAGSIVNRTGRALRNVRLFYRNWGYRLGNLATGEKIELGEQYEPRSTKTLLTASVLGTTVPTPGQAEGRMFLPERASTLELLNLMMFYEAIGGLNFADLPNRYQAFCDLSGILKPGLGRAVFVAEVPHAGSRLVDKSIGDALGSDGDFSAVVYRFVIPVATSQNEAE
jgi:hypothetical protein